MFKKPDKGKRDKQTSVVLTAEQRMEVYQKYDGCCAYCGNGIEFFQMEVDHMEAKSRFRDQRDADFIENFMPACKPCNIRKNTMSIERFRRELSRDIEQLKRDSPKFRLMLKYGKIQVSDHEIEFYFEKVKKGNG